ncbi:MAG: hypothetical protein H6737_20790 [Alphaproteobacteria bacterium]|nr:hypothetical protein [Alphaproteobacteria bacterium]
MILVALAGCLNAYTPDEEPPIVPEDHPCAGEPAGPWAGHPLDGATIRSSRYTHDAGLAAVLAAMPAEGETVSVSLPVSGAVVVNVGFDENTGDPPLWLADGAGGVRTFGVPGLGAYAPGDTLSFTVTELKSYFGELEITALTGIEVTSTDDAVHVFSAGGAPVRFPEDRGLNAEFVGLYTGDSADDCGDNPCIVLDNDVTTQTLDLRVPWPGGLVADQTCVHVLAPVEFTRGDVRIGASALDWIRSW